MLEEIKDVGASIWISASAGTGKTKSLIDRILALLLNHAIPSKILCLTYTKAAATEMLSRLSAYVQYFATISDEELIAELDKLDFAASYASTARNLYQKSIIPSHWVQIKTIHSFCFEILQKFPLETGLMPGISLCSEYERNQLLREAIDAVIFSEDSYKFSRLLANFTTDISDILKDHLLKFQKFFAKFDNFNELYCDFFDISSDNRDLLFSKNRDQILVDKIFDGRSLEIFTELASILSKGEKEDNKKADILISASHSNNNISSFIYAFLTKDLNIRSKMCNKKLAIAYPDLSAKMQEAAHKALDFCERRNQIISAEANIALFSVMNRIITHFSELKRKKHCVDFDDIISITSSLLNNIDWVMFKIDNGVDHMLIDEAQDTSPEQWDIIRRITDEFFENYGSEKTVFVVGDEKQSIYSFQGADVQIFQKMHELFEKRSMACGQRFHNINLNKSYRTTGHILAFVDNVFSGIFKNSNHNTNRKKNAGVVDFVRLFEDDVAETDTDNSNRDSKPNSESTSTFIPTFSQDVTADRKLAQYIADFIKHTINSGTFVESRNRTAIPSDFMILFQRRNLKSMREITKVLRRNGIPASGIDRMLLKNEIIIEDLLTFAQFAVFPVDDLLCARVLRSIIVGISDDELMNLCLMRGEKSLWEYCQQDTNFCSKYDLTATKELMNQATSMSAYAFFSQILTNGISEKFIAKLGTQCLDALYDFIDTVTSYEKENTASLQSFLDWFHLFGNDIEIKRESFSSENCVRIMTVHASKGLQSPFVLLADTHFYNAKNDRILKTVDEVLIWDFAADFRTKEVQELCAEYAQSEVSESYRRLYVALTRAEDYVGILGVDQDRRSSDCWYDTIQNIADFSEFNETTDNGVKRFGKFGYAEFSEFSDEKIENRKDSNSFCIPDWFYEKLPISEDSNTLSEQQSIQTEQMIYGDCVHFLLSIVPNMNDETLKSIFYDPDTTLMDTLLANFDLPDSLKKKATKEVANLLKNEKFAFIFDSESLSEVSFVDSEGKEGRIDKIAFDPHGDIWVIDFKTEKYQETIPPKYIKQLARYKKAVYEMFLQDKNEKQSNPVHCSKIKTAILWTAESRLSEINS